MGQFLGEVGASGTLTWNPSTKILSWSTTGAADPAVYVNGTLVAKSGASGSTNWIYSGERFLFELRDNGGVLAYVDLAPDGTVMSQTEVQGPPPPPRSGEGEAQTPPGGGIVPQGASWFEQSTNLFGVDIPNLAFVAGGGLLVLIALKQRKR